MKFSFKSRPYFLALKKYVTVEAYWLDGVTGRYAVSSKGELWSVPESGLSKQAPRPLGNVLNRKLSREKSEASKADKIDPRDVPVLIGKRPFRACPNAGVFTPEDLADLDKQFEQTRHTYNNPIQKSEPTKSSAPQTLSGISRKDYLVGLNRADKKKKKK